MHVCTRLSGKSGELLLQFLFLLLHQDDLLCTSIKQGDLDTVRRLVDEGANINIKDNNGVTLCDRVCMASTHGKHLKDMYTCVKRLEAH